MANVGERLRQLFLDLPNLRGFVADKGSIEFITKQLKADNFTTEQMDKAELWIRKGKWDSFHPRQLLLSDFYPTSEQLKEFGYICMTKQELKAKIEAAVFEEKIKVEAREREYYNNRLKIIKDGLIT